MAQNEQLSGGEMDFADDDPFLNRFLPGPSAGMRKLRAEVYDVNKEENEALIRFILLTGETGSGKYRVAQAIAGYPMWVKQGRRAPREALSFYAKRLGELLLTALGEGTAESELFGHVAGAFTGAVGSKPGLFDDSEFDDLLLDEIGDAPPIIQGKLLSVLEGRPFTPVGASGKERNKRCGKRILMATKQDLRQLVKHGRFRDDLFHRVVRRVIHVPALRHNAESIPDIAGSLVEERCSRPLLVKLGGLPALGTGDLSWAKTQPWPGNVRQLGDVIEDWLTAGARVSLQEIARRRMLPETEDLPRHNEIRLDVRRRIEDVLSGETASPGTIGRLVSDYTDPIQAAVKAELYGWYLETRADEGKCRRLFDNATWNSVKTEMSEIKKATRGSKQS